MELEREMKVRKEIRSDFNLQAKDFGCQACDPSAPCISCLDKYNDYLELTETLIWNRLHDTNEDWTAEQIRRNLHDNREKIQANKAEQDHRNRKLQEEERLQQEKRIRDFRIRVLKDEEDRLMKQVEKEETVKVALGQMSKSNTSKALAVARAKREAEEEQARKDALLETRFAPAPPRYEANDMDRLWPQFKVQAQPRVDKSADEDDDFMDLSPDDLRECQRVAGGFFIEEAHKRTEELMYVGL